MIARISSFISVVLLSIFLAGCHHPATEAIDKKSEFIPIGYSDDGQILTFEPGHFNWLPKTTSLSVYTVRKPEHVSQAVEECKEIRRHADFTIKFEWRNQHYYEKGPLWVGIDVPEFNGTNHMYMFEVQALKNSEERAIYRGPYVWKLGEDVCVTSRTGTSDIYIYMRSWQEHRRDRSTQEMKWLSHESDSWNKLVSRATTTTEEGVGVLVYEERFERVEHGHAHFMVPSHMRSLQPPTYTTLHRWKD